MGIIELFESGFFSALWNWSVPLLTLLEYISIVIGAVVQLILEKKCKTKSAKNVFLILCAIGTIACELAWQLITGWERLGTDFIYGFVVCILLGAVLTAIIARCVRRKHGEEDR